MSKIIDNPLIYSVCENLPTKAKIYREATYKTWLIIFKVKNNNITILGVLSGKRKTSSFQKTQIKFFTHFFKNKYCFLNPKNIF